VHDLIAALTPDADALVQRVLDARVDSERNRSLRNEIVLRFLAELLADDERARFFGLPDSCRVRERTKILAPAKLVCGEHVWIGENAYIDASGGLEIGDHTTIGVGVYVWTHTSVLSNLLHENRPGGAHVIRRSTRIGAGCYIVGHSVVNPGTTIGDGAVVLPMSCVADDVAPGDIVAGAPARSLGAVTDDFRRRLEDELRRTRDSST
jgi:acetyltransferase-like isoleucine patch superfamily enzyme